MRETRLGYSGAQIALHWTIAVLVVLQIVLHDGIIAAYTAARGVGTATESELFLADLHVAFGIAVFVLAVLRVALRLRLRRGAPPPPEDEHPALRLAARATHIALYALILLMPVTGGLAWFAGLDTMAELHRAGKAAVLVLVGLHVLGALYQHFYLRTDVLRRMLRPER